MKPLVRSACRVVAGVATALAIAAGLSGNDQTVSAQTGAKAPGLRFEISFPASAHAQPVTGRVFVMISRTPNGSRGSRSGGPACRSSAATSRRSRRGRRRVIDQTDLGSPVESLTDIPPGEYFVQALVNVYTEFKRADGHVVWMHDDQWEGQRWNRLAGEPLQRRAEDHGRSGERWCRPAERGEGHSAGRGAARHEVGQAVQVPEPLRSRSSGAGRSISAPSCCCRATTTARR